MGSVCVRGGVIQPVTLLGEHPHQQCRLVWGGDGNGVERVMGRRGRKR